MSILDALADSALTARQSPALMMRWSKWQRTFLADGRLYRLARTCNQVGKTTVGAADMTMEIDGTNPFRPRRFDGPINATMVGESIEQLSAAGGPLEKLWMTLPQGTVDPAIYFERGRGIRGTKIPVIPIVYGPGAGSTISIRTYKQSPQSMAGTTLHYVWGDEPMPEHVYGELMPRVLKHGGLFVLTLTPTLNMPDMGYVRNLVDDQVFHEHWVPLSEDAAWPEGYARPFLTKDKIEAFRASLPEVERAMRCEASWEPVLTERWLTAFDDSLIRDVELKDYVGAELVVGIDHGLKPGKQGAVLVAVQGGNTNRPRVAVLAEYNPGITSRPEDDARGILDMLASVGLEYDHVDRWFGDQDAERGIRVSSKGNAQLREELAVQLDVDSQKTKWIERPNKGRNSLQLGMNHMNAMMQRGDFVVDRRCVRLIDAARKFKGDPRDPVKDIMDACRYAVMGGCSGRGPQGLRATY